MNSGSDALLLFPKEDHTIGNLLRHQLLKNPEVIFAGYKVPHPLERSVEVRSQTMGTPVRETVDIALNELIEEVDDFETVFREALSDTEEASSETDE